MSFEKKFKKYRKNTIGINHTIKTPFGKKKMVYADWVASGRLYKDIEEKMVSLFGPLVGNTHSEASETGKAMTFAYHQAQEIIKRHVNAGENDMLISYGSGMTGVINKLQRLLGLRFPEKVRQFQNCMGKCLPKKDRPVVFITHMEHHSNHISWLETMSDVVILKPGADLTVNPTELEEQLKKYKDRTIKIGSFTACSNVTGIRTPYHQLSRIMHRHGGICIVDFAASAPYDSIDMHPTDPEEALDAILFSPHKFLGGPGSCGILIMDKGLRKQLAPDNPGGGTVSWTNRWNEYKYVDNVEAMEDGGTPAFLQTIRTALAIKLKEEMGVENIHLRERELLKKAFTELETVENIHILAPEQKERLGVISFYISDMHHNLVVRMLNDRYGIQVRGGCSCAGTYGHYLLAIGKEESAQITQEVDKGNSSVKPGWIRLSLHPTMSNKELGYILKAIGEVAEKGALWKRDYSFDSKRGEYLYRGEQIETDYTKWFAFYSFTGFSRERKPEAVS